MTDLAKMSPDKSTDAVQALVLQHAKRGAEQLAVHSQGHLRSAALSIVHTANSRIVIVTGFLIGDADTGHPETDGPIGAVQLAHFLQTAGWNVTITTDDRCAAAVACGRSIMNGMFDIQVLSDVADIAEMRAAWDAGHDTPSHVIAIERAGPAANGNVHNMRGIDISAVTAPLHLLFEGTQAERPFKTITICDGVNEIGMGYFTAEMIAVLGPLDVSIQCAVSVDHVVLAGVSNWGAVGLGAAMTLADARRAPQFAGAFGPQIENEIAAALCEGQIAVDGVTKTFTRQTVDGISMEIGNEVTKSVMAVANAAQKMDEVPHGLTNV